MAGRIPESEIRAVLEATDIVSLVERYLPLEKKGSSNYFGLCPFHKEKTPSFSVNQEKKIFYCFGCHEGGNAIRFVEKVENLTFPEAVRFLAERAGIEIHQDKSPAEVKKEKERKVLESALLEAARFFYQQLQSREGDKARKYLYQERGLNQATARRFGLGYSGEEWDALSNRLKGKGFSDSVLIASGLCRKNQRGKLYDVFRGRLIFPVFDPWGKLIAFGGRILSKEKEQAKYINSSESELFHKREQLFALNFARTSDKPYFLLTEGYMDTISLHAYGFDSAVASLGTALSPQQARLLAERERPVILNYDSDEAGQRATERAIELLRQAGAETKILLLHDAKDADQFLRQFGSDHFAALLRQAMPVLDYKLYKARQASLSETGVLNRLQYQNAAIPILAAENNAVLRELYARKLAEEIGVSPPAIMEEINRSRLPSPKIRVSTPPALKKSARTLNSAELAILSALLADSRLVSDPELGLRTDIFRQDTRTFFDRVFQFCESGSLSFAELIQIAGEEEEDDFKNEIILKLQQLKPSRGEELRELVQRAMKRIEISRAEEDLQLYLEKASGTKDDELRKDYLQKAAEAEKELNLLGGIKNGRK